MNVAHRQARGQVDAKRAKMLSASPAGAGTAGSHYSREHPGRQTGARLEGSSTPGVDGAAGGRARGWTDLSDAAGGSRRA